MVVPILSTNLTVRNVALTMSSSSRPTNAAAKADWSSRGGLGGFNVRGLRLSGIRGFGGLKGLLGFGLT